MTDKHTPWNSHDCPRCNGTGEERYSQLPVDIPDNPCQFCGGLGSIDWRLIAAAPDLLEALADAVKELQTLIRCDNPNNPITNATTDMRIDWALTAIRKARGEDA